jgi:hypothetical protein
MVFSRLFSRIKQGLQHAFAVKGEHNGLSAEDLVLLERVAEAVVTRGMAVPAVLFLESLGPMNFLGSQALHCLTPILDAIFPQREIEQVACLLEKRTALAYLASLIETRVVHTATPSH